MNVDCTFTPSELLMVRTLPDFENPPAVETAVGLDVSQLPVGTYFITACCCWTYVKITQFQELRRRWEQ